MIGTECKKTNSALQTKRRVFLGLVVVAYAYNTSTWEAEAGGSLEKNASIY
jgi:hypothetical protein